MRGWRGALAAAALLAVVALLTVGGTLGARYASRRPYLSTMDGCDSTPPRPPHTFAPSAAYPYGTIRACRVLDAAARAWGPVDVSYVVLLETDTGPLLARVDVADLDAGRQFTAVAVELDPADGDLPPGEVDRIARAIAHRGGLRPIPWTTHYGDG